MLDEKLKKYIYIHNTNYNKKQQQQNKQLK